MGRLSLALPALLCLLVGAARSQAEESAGDKAARKAGAELRSGVPAPNPGVRLDFEGDLIIEDLWAGEVRLSVRLAKLGPAYVWRITEDMFMDWSGGEIREKLMVHAGADLAVRSGTYERSDREGTISLGFARTESGFEGQRRTQSGETWGEPQTVTLRAAPNALTGLASVLLLLRPAAPAGAVLVPWVPTPDFKRPEQATPGEMRLTPKGPGTFEYAGTKTPTFVVAMDGGGTRWDLHLTKDRKELVAMVSDNGPVKIVPKGLGGTRVAVDPHEPATTWQQAFLKFGFGYHMARTGLLADAFHWDRMYEHETKVLKRWPEDQPVEAFREAWIAEFVAGSKHRDVPATRRLLSMTLATGKIQKQTDTEVVFWAHPNFGGGIQRTYYLEKRDGLWGLVRIEFKE